MSIFSKKKPITEDTEYVVLPQSKERALAEAMKNKNRRIGRLDLKKDLARYMAEHRFDKVDTRRLSRTYKIKAIED